MFKNNSTYINNKFKNYLFTRKIWLSIKFRSWKRWFWTWYFSIRVFISDAQHSCPKIQNEVICKPDDTKLTKIPLISEPRVKIFILWETLRIKLKTIELPLKSRWRYTKLRNSLSERTYWWNHFNSNKHCQTNQKRKQSQITFLRNINNNKTSLKVLKKDITNHVQF